MHISWAGLTPGAGPVASHGNMLEMQGDGLDFSVVLIRKENLCLKPTFLVSKL